MANRGGYQIKLKGGIPGAVGKNRKKKRKKRKLYTRALVVLQ